MNEIVEAMRKKANFSKFRMGKIVVGFCGSNRMSQHVLEEVSASLPRSADNPDVVFVFSEASDLSAEQDLTRRHVGLPLRVVSPQNPLIIEAAVLQDPFELLAGYNLCRRIANWGFLDKPETQAKNFFYNVFDWSTQICQAFTDQSYIHASAVTRNGRTVAILGKGGVGKTTAMLRLCIEDGWHYLSDDLAAIDAEGIVYRSPKKLQIYAYNAEDEGEVTRRILMGRSVIDRAQWTFRRSVLGPKRVRRRITAESLLGKSGVATAGKLTDLFFVERSGERGCASRQISSNEVAALMAPIVMEEIEPYSRIKRETRDAHLMSLPDPADIECSTLSVLNRALSGISPLLLTVGTDTTPSMMLRAIRELLSDARR